MISAMGLIYITKVNVFHSTHYGKQRRKDVT